MQEESTSSGADASPNTLQPGRGNVRALQTEARKSFRRTIHHRVRVWTQAAPESVNWFITAWCNYACQFCFFTPKGYEGYQPGPEGLIVSMDEARRLLEELRAAGTRKVTFVGGEPTLVPALPTLVGWTDELGMAPMVVTNGTGLTTGLLDSLAPHLTNPTHPGAIKLSLDSGVEAAEVELGRATAAAMRSGTGNHVRLIIRRAEELHRRRIPLMVNTVVTARTWQEDMHPVLQALGPNARWKVFQMLPITGQNEAAWSSLAISREQFQAFVRRHADLDPIAEDNDAMTESYVMVDPLARFFQNTGGRHTFSRPLLEVGVRSALAEVGWRRPKFLARQGRYTLRLPRVPERRFA